MFQMKIECWYQMQRALNAIDCIWNRLLLKIDMIYLNMKKKKSNRVLCTITDYFDCWAFQVEPTVCGSGTLISIDQRPNDSYTNNLSWNWQQSWKIIQHKKPWTGPMVLFPFRTSFLFLCCFYDVFFLYGYKFLFHSIFSTWRSFDNNTINSIFGEKKNYIDCIAYRRDETGLKKRAMSLCWLWMCGIEKKNDEMLNMFFIIYLHFSEHSCSLNACTCICLCVVLAIAWETYPSDKNAINWKYAHVDCRKVYGWSGQTNVSQKNNTTTTTKQIE